MAFFTIITVTFNAEAGIEKTLKSILSQSFSDYEIIIKDAGSCDSTLSLIPDDPRISIITKPDTGIYDGMNQAIDISKGKYILFLNSGDILNDEFVLSKVYEAARTNQFPAVIYGDVIYKNKILAQPSKMNSFNMYRRGLCHQSVFFTKTLFDKYGTYDLSYKIKADFAYLVMLEKNREIFLHIPTIICIYEGGGASEQDKKNINAIEEKIIYRKYFTLLERIKYNLLLVLSFRRLRMYMISDSAPGFMRDFYQKLANHLNRKF